MNVLIIGSGGRENAILKELTKTSQPMQYFCDSPNALMQRSSKAVGEFTLESAERILSENNIDLVIFGPEKPLVQGLADVVRKTGVLSFGPDRNAAQLEGSKIFAKDFMEEFQIPTAKAVKVRTVEELKYTSSNFTPPYVLKADGLCAGKGVFICKNMEELLNAGRLLFEEKIFGDQGTQALLEQFEPGDEISYFFLTNGKDAVPLPVFRDHKRLNEGDKGPNTGGMGVIGPVDLHKDLEAQLYEQILVPTIKGFQSRGFDYRGVVFVGVMLTPFGPKVLEYNVRFGDPETQAILPSLNPSGGDDWLSAFSKVARGELPNLKWRKSKVACVVGAAGGYPDNPEKGVPIEGDVFLDNGESYVLHAGTKMAANPQDTNTGASAASSGNPSVVTAGGRVLNYVGIGESYAEALRKAYAATEKCSFKGVQIRRDIGHSLLAKTKD